MNNKISSARAVEQNRSINIQFGVYAHINLNTVNNVMLTIIHKNIDVILFVCIKFCRCSYMHSYNLERQVDILLSENQVLKYYIM